MTREEVEEKIKDVEGSFTGELSFRAGMALFIAMIRAVVQFVDERTK